MNRDVKFQPVDEPPVPVEPVSAARWRPWYWGYPLALLLTSGLAFGPWLNLSWFPHSYRVDPYELLTGGFVPAGLAIVFWAVCWRWGFHRVALGKTLATFSLLGVAWVYTILQHTGHRA